jgi:hypothetical protein
MPLREIGLPIKYIDPNYFNQATNYYSQEVDINNIDQVVINSLLRYIIINSKN